jgi:hypothetical protein
MWLADHLIYRWRAFCLLKRDYIGCMHAGVCICAADVLRVAACILCMIRPVRHLQSPQFGGGWGG